MILDGLTGIVLIDAGAGISYGPFYVLTGLGFLLPGISVMVRRLHDSGRSGWWYFIGLVPCVGIIILLVFLIQDGQPHPNDYGEVPTNTL
jgi:uncharacterized membrane protein YhaH (DUF805 family)